MAGTYRESQKKTVVLDSSDEGEVSSGEYDSDEANAVWGSKRSRQTGNATLIVPVIVINGDSRPKRSKNVNIWGSVLAEQSSNDISSSLGAVGMERYISRGPESFDLPATFKNDLNSDSSSNEDRLEEEQPVQSEPKVDAKKNVNGASANNKRKRKKPKNKNNTPAYKPGQKVTLNKRCELSDTDPVDKVSEELAFRLWERKKDLIRSLTETMGVPLAIDLYNKTEDIEKNGGLLTLQGSRRRTPGGTFIHLIRNDPRVDQEPISKVFSLESERDRIHWEQRKQERKMKKAERTEASNLVEMTACAPSAETMECNEVGTGAAVQDSSAVGEHVMKCHPQDGAGVAKNFQPNKETADVELSDGEIPDSDEDNANLESFG